MVLPILKLLFIVAIFAAGWMAGIVPLRRAQSDPSAAHFHYGNAFASGIILGTGLLHMLPESDLAWRALVPEYPVAFVFAAAAFLFLLLVEHVVLAGKGHSHGDQVTHGSHELAGELGVHAVDRQLSAYILLAGLSIHSVLAGMALGAQRTLPGALSIFLAILAHKSTEGFALGVSLARHRAIYQRAEKLLVVFAAATPLGIVAGTLLSDALSSHGAAIFDAALTAIAAGTFIYIASLDIISEEFSHGQQPFQKWCLAVAGVAATALLALWM
jgi:zinc transporter 1/2/3